MRSYQVADTGLRHGLGSAAMLTLRYAPYGTRSDARSARRASYPGPRRALAYPVPVPVSRKRKKARKSSRRARSDTYAAHGGSGDVWHELTTAMAGFAEYRRQLDERRASLAAAAAKPMIAELLEFAATRSDTDLEDELCVRIGARLAELDDATIDNDVGPNVFAEAVIDAAAR